MDTDVIHGDIKPQNVLVFKDTTGKTTVKVADFGYSTLAVSEMGKVFLPKSRPWNAPEHHHGEFTVSEAKKTDVYFFGMLCLWVLYGNRLSDILPVTTEVVTESDSFATPFSSPTLLERLKVEDQVVHIAYQLTLTTSDLSDGQKACLNQFFSSTVCHSPENRASDIGTLMGLFSQEQ